MRKCIMMSILFFCLTGAKVFAYDIAVANDDGKTIYYMWTNNNTELSVTHGNLYFSNYYTGEIVIPESVTYQGSTYPVTSINTQAFYKCYSVTSIIIPNSVTVIGWQAFENCSGLTNIDIPKSVNYIGGGAFYGCSSLSSVAFPNSIKTIDSQTFYGCSSLSNVSIPNSVTSIGDKAFYGCSSLTSFVIPDSVTTIEEESFSRCGLESLTIGKNINSIKLYAFAECRNLTSISVLSSKIDVGIWPFINCVNLTKANFHCNNVCSILSGTSIKNVIIGDEVETIGEDAFKECSGLTEVKVGNSLISIGNNAFYGCSKLTNFTIPSCVTTIGDAAFSNCRLSSIDIPNSVTTIGSNAFEGCNLKSLIIPNSVIQIGDEAFYGCSYLTKVSILSDITSIGAGMFSHCRSLSSIVLPESVTEIGNYAFYYCDSLESINIPKNVTTIGKYAFYNCGKLKNVYCYPEIVPSLASYAFPERQIIYVSDVASQAYISKPEWNHYYIRTKYSTSIEVDGLHYYLGAITPFAEVIGNSNGNEEYGAVIKIPKAIIINEIEYRVKYIDNSAFAGCSNIISVTIPGSVQRIGARAFSGCSSLASVDISEGVTSIETAAFMDCPYLTSLTIPNSVTQISSNAFANCNSLSSITLPNSLTNLEESLFNGCSSLASLTIPQSVTSIGSYTFSRCIGLKSISIPNGVETIGNGAFRECIGLKSMSIPNGVTSIGSSAFEGCSGLTSIFLPNSVSNIGSSAFQYCSSLASLSIPNGVTSIEDKTFYMCSGLTSINMPNSVTSIGVNAFYACDNLLSITIPNSVNTIGEAAFENCIRMTSVNIPEGLKAIKKKTFIKCYSLKNITIPSSVEYIYQEAFARCTGLNSVNVLSTKPPFLFDDSFSNYSIPVKVPKGCKEAYSTAQGWKNFMYISDADKYKLTYQVDGAEYMSSEIEYGATITPEVAPTKEGYTFSGWSEIPETMPANNVTITGTFSVNKYKLTYSVDGEGYKNYEIEYGATITPEAAPTKEGYTFSGWSEVPETMPANDVTITGTFSVNKYKLIYQVDNENYKTVEVEYGATVTPEAAITKEGYTFSGWSEIPETMPANDITVTGTFSVNKYKLIYSVDGKEYKNYEIDYGTSITSEAAPTKEGYTFSGWSEIPATMPAKDVMVTGTFSVNKYKLTYSVDGEEYKSYEVEYGTSITPETLPTKEGYTFSGWSEIPATMPANDVTITGTFSVNKYKLTYSVDGEEYKNYEIDYGTNITSEATPTKEGYTFSGWTETPETMPANDVTITGKFTINKYKLVYMVDGVEYKSYDIEYGATITEEAEPTKEGHTFSGWGSIPATMPANDVTLTGTFTKGAYKLTYMVDGEVYMTVSYDYDSTITPGAAPTKEGYTFGGWSEIPETMPANDVTITGKFTVNKYKLVYMVDGVEYKSYDIEYGATITEEAEPTKEGHTFSGWGAIPATMPANDVTVTGTFTKEAYKLTYMVDGEVYKTVSYDFDSTITPEAAPTKEGYTFSGWSEIPATMPAKDVTVTGTFSVNKYKLIYSVDDEEYKSYEIDYGTSITPETEPTKEGYTFGGWSEMPETMPANDVTITGTFSINKYKLAYMVDGVEYKSYDIEYGATITAEEEPTKEGHTFSGWGSIPATMPANDVTVTGTFIKGAYKLTYMVDGEVYKTVSYDYDSTITPEAAPTKEGYTFSGWSEIPESMPAMEVTVNGTFTINTYKLTYMIDDKVHKVMEVEYGATITPEPQPEGDYVTFAWIDLPQTMPANDIVVHASYTSGINSLLMARPKDVRIYSTGGKKQTKLKKGVNIIRMGNGKAQKVVVK